MIVRVKSQHLKFGALVLLAATLGLVALVLTRL
jgi:hypothetical protein